MLAFLPVAAVSREASAPPVYGPFTSVVDRATALRTSPTPTVEPSFQRPSTTTASRRAFQRPMPTPSASPAPTPKPRATPKPQPKATAAPRTSPTKGDFSATVTEARRYALERLGKRQFACLDTLVRRESGWRVTATNKSSGAYGLPQALPGSKMGKYGSDWKTNATTQLRWMIAYVNGRYGSACQALSHAQRTGWY